MMGIQFHGRRMPGRNSEPGRTGGSRAAILALVGILIASTSGGRAAKLENDSSPLDRQVLTLAKPEGGGSVRLATPLVLPRVALEDDAWVDLAQAGDAIVRC